MNSTIGPVNHTDNAQVQATGAGLYESRSFLVGSGVLSLVVLLYVGLAYTSLTLACIAYPHDEQKEYDQQIAILQSLFSEPAIIGLHATVSVLGAILAILFIIDEYRNPRISKGSRELWFLAVISGLGLVFYWYFHIRHRNHLTAPGNS